MSGPADDDGNLDLEAAEYVIGTLDLGERAAFESRLGRDPEARRLSAAWHRRLAALAAEVEPVQPSAGLWLRIEQAMRLDEANAREPLPFRVIQGGGGAIASAHLRSRNRWRAAALVSGTIAAAMLTFIVVRGRDLPSNPSPQTTFVAAINRGGDKPALIIRVDLKTRQVLVRPVAAEAPSGHSLELWYIAGGGPPRSLGLVADRPARVAMPPDAPVDGTVTFAISVEPEGGSKTGGPTGPVVYSGTLIEE